MEASQTTSQIKVKKSDLVIPATIRIGVTGKREIPDVEKVRDFIRKALALLDGSIKKWLPVTPYEYIVMSPLEEGADRLVADEVLKFTHSGMSAKPELEVALPYGVDDYKKRWSADSQKEFDDLLSKAYYVEEMPQTDTSVNHQDAYVLVGQYIVRNCDVLIVIWDGASGRKGGTKEILDYAEKNGCPRIVINRDTGDIQAVLDEGNFEHLTNLETYNIEPVPLGEIEEATNRRFTSIIKKAGGNPGILKSLNLYCPILFPHHSRASILAQRYQTLHHKTGIAVYLLSALAVSIVAVQTIFFPERPWLLIFEVACMGFVLYFISESGKKKWHRRWTDYRFLAERIRSLLFLCAVQIDCEHPKAPSLINDWVVRAFNEIWANLPGLEKCEPSVVKTPVKKNLDIAVRDFVRTAWFEDQNRFYRNSSARQFERHNELEKWGFRLFIITLIAAALHTLSSIPVLHGFLLPVDPLFAVIALICPALGAAMDGIRTHLEYHRNAERYRHMTGFLDALIDESRLITGHDTFVEIVKSAFNAMFQENLDWRLTFFNRRHEAP